MDYKHTSDTIFTRFQGITNNIYGLFGCLEDPFLPVHHPSTHISTRPYSFLTVQMMGGRVST